MTYPREFLLQHIKDLSNFKVPDAAVFYEKDPNYTVGQDACTIKLKWRTLQGQGTEELRRDWDAVRQVFVTSVVGWRKGVLTLTCEAFDYQVEAGDVLDGIAIRMCRDAALVDRVAHNVGWVENGNTQELPTEYDNRVVNAATVDITFNVLSVDTQNDVDSWIGTVNGNNVIPGVQPLTFAGEANGSSSAQCVLV